MSGAAGRGFHLVDPATDPWRDPTDDERAGGSLRPQPYRILRPEDLDATAGHAAPARPLALCLDNAEDPMVHAAWLDRVAMVVLAFPKWTDGRAYSQARLLRARLRYAGGIRARGDVVLDMLPLLVRTGFDSAQLRADQRADLAPRVLAGFADGHYQGDVLEPRPRFARG